MDKNSIQDWWADHPMTYGDTHGKGVYEDEKYAIGTRDFFERLDREFYSWNKPLHKKKPFDKLFPYSDFSEKSRVLEIGCGLGTMAMNWALHGVNMTAVDLNPVSIEQTKKRFALYGLSGDIHCEDGNKLSFDNERFDYAYSWGVLHHSPHLEQSIAELFRVTKPGGGFGIMLYNRHSLYNWYMHNYLEGFMHFENNFLSPLELASRYADAGREEGNPYTMPVTVREVVATIQPFSDDVKSKIFGTDLEYVFTYLLPGMGKFVPLFIKKAWARRFGWSIWFYGHKI